MASSYKSGESVRERGRLIRDVFDALQNGLIAYEKKIVENNIVMSSITSGSEIKRVPGLTSKFGIAFNNFILKSVDYDRQTQTKLDEHRLLEQQRNNAVLAAEKLKQETITAQAEEEKLMAETSAQEEHKKLEAQIRAETEKQVAQINAEKEREVTRFSTVLMLAAIIFFRMASVRAIFMIFFIFSLSGGREYLTTPLITPSPLSLKITFIPQPVLIFSSSPSSYLSTKLTVSEILNSVTVLNGPCQYTPGS